MIELRKSNNFWVYETYSMEAKKYVNRSEFHKNSCGAYNVARRDNNLNKICSHMVNKSKYWTETKYIIEALKYVTKYEFQKKSSGAYEAARRDGNLDKICSHMPKRSTHRISKIQK